MTKETSPPGGTRRDEPLSWPIVSWGYKVNLAKRSLKGLGKRKVGWAVYWEDQRGRKAFPSPIPSSGSSRKGQSLVYFAWCTCLRSPTEGPFGVYENTVEVTRPSKGKEKSFCYAVVGKRQVRDQEKIMAGEWIDTMNESLVIGLERRLSQ